MNRNTRIFLFGVVIIGLGVLIVRSVYEDLFVYGAFVILAGLAISANGAFTHDQQPTDTRPRSPRPEKQPQNP